MTRAPASLSELIRYAAPALPAAFAGTPLYLLAPDHYAAYYGASLAVLGTVLAGLRVTDAALDPVIGALTDRVAAAPDMVMAAAGFIAWASVTALFQKPDTVAAPLWFAGCMALAACAHCALSAALNAAAAKRAEGNEQELARFSSARELAALTGLTAAVTLPALFNRFFSTEGAYLCFSAVLLALTLIGLAAFRRRPYVEDSKAQTRAACAVGAATPMESGKIGTLLGRPGGSLRRFYGAYFISMTAQAIPSVTFLMYARDVLHAEHLSGLFLLTYFVSAALATPLWRRAALRIGAAKAWAAGCVLSAVGLLPALWASPAEPAVFWGVCVLTGAALGAELTLPPALLAACARAENPEAPRYGFRYGTAFALTKGALALAAAFALPLLQWQGLHPGGVNTPESLTWLRLVYAAVPAFIKLTACFAVMRFAFEADARQPQQA